MRSYMMRKEKLPKKLIPFIEKLMEKFIKEVNKNNYKEKVNKFFKDFISELEEHKYSDRTIRAQLSRLTSSVVDRFSKVSIS